MVGLTFPAPVGFIIAKFPRLNFFSKKKKKKSVLDLWSMLGPILNGYTIDFLDFYDFNVFSMAEGNSTFLNWEPVFSIPAKGKHRKAYVVKIE